MAALIFSADSFLRSDFDWQSLSRKSECSEKTCSEDSQSGLCFDMVIDSMEH